MAFNAKKPVPIAATVAKTPTAPPNVALLAKAGKLPDDIPNWPYGIYKNKGWISYLDWIGK